MMSEVDALLAADEHILEAMGVLADTGETDTFMALQLVRKGITYRLHQLARAK